jgi:hypothetical protein
LERVPPVESKIGGTGWTEGGEGSPERRARAGDRIEHNTTTGGLESGRETCGSVELRGVRRFYFPCLRLMTSPDSSTASLRCVSPVPARPSFGAGYLRVPRNLAPGIRRFYFPLAEEVPSISFLFRLQERGRDGRKSKGRKEQKEGRKEGRTLDLFDPKRPLPFWRTSASLSDPRNAFPSHLLFLSAWSRSVTQPWGSI